jgi:hypothetical protein
MRVFQETVGRRVRGEGSQDDVHRAQQTLQSAQRRYQAAGQALQAAKAAR